MSAEQEADIVFGYLDWCRDQGMSFEETAEHDNAMRYGKLLHDEGVEVNGLHIALMKGMAFR